VLCQQVGETPQLFPALRGLCWFYINRGALPTARELGAQLVSSLAQGAATPMLRLAAHAVLGSTLFHQGAYAGAWTHLEQCSVLADPTAQWALALRQGDAPGVGGLAHAAPTLWCLGYPAQAVRWSQEALALAQGLAHPYKQNLRSLRRNNRPSQQIEKSFLSCGSKSFRLKFARCCL
jgi:hypothetical protein